MAKASRTISHIEEQMSQNTIFETWTENWGIKVYPAYGIDKLKFSFVEKGAKGRGKSFDIFVECLRDGTQCFDNWAYDILHSRFERILNAEKQAGEKYPNAYKYITGETAEKSVGIMNSIKGGYCINASYPGEKDKNGKQTTIYANVPVSFHDLRHIAERYMVSYAPRKAELEEIRKSAAEKLANWNKDDEAQEEKTEAPVQATKPVTKEKPVQKETPSNVPTATVKDEKPQTSAKEELPTPETRAVEFRTSSTLTEDSKGNLILEAIDKQNKTATFVFPKKYWDKEKYGKIGNQFKAKASEKDGIMVVLHYYVYNNKNYVAKIGK